MFNKCQRTTRVSVRSIVRPLHRLSTQITACKALKAGFSETPAIFTVIVNGKDCNGKEYRISNVYEEYHPLMAIGRAVVEFRKTIIVGSIEHILISERVVSNK